MKALKWSTVEKKNLKKKMQRETSSAVVQNMGSAARLLVSKPSPTGISCVSLGR